MMPYLKKCWNGTLEPAGTSKRTNKARGAREVRSKHVQPECLEGIAYSHGFNAAIDEFLRLDSGLDDKGEK